jgi:ABC-type multidrug transport system fused ATPase/permease subunit
MLVDNTLMLQIFMWILILALGVVSYNLPLFLAIVGGLTVIYVYVVMLYIRTSVPLKKAAGQSVSNVVAHTSETLSGLAVVRAFRMQERFLNENVQFQSRSTVVSFCIANLSLWLAFRVDIVGSFVLVLACCLLAVADASMEASVAGLIVSNSFRILLLFSLMSRTMGEVHDNMLFDG